ncbi:MAG: ABC transporter substrate-binding protein [Parvibaculaceae bacterium]
MKPGFAVILGAAVVLSTPAASATVKQGGAAVVTFSNELTTLDPQVGYDWQNWSVIKSIFDGLMDYKPGTTELEPDLAESYAVSADGLTYTFKLRPGVRFHNGRSMDSRDVKYSLERAVSPKTQSPGSGYFSAILGYDDLVAGKAQELSGVKTPDDRTVEITLTRPDATFLHLMAINFSYVVPREEVEKAGTNWARQPVGTGSFRMVEWTSGQKLVLERNRNYYRGNLPYLDRITFEFGQDPTIAVLRVKNGEVDIAGDGIPPAQFIEITTDAATKALVVEGEQLHTAYLAMNVTKPPFDDVNVRRAVNMAINKDRIVRLINNRAKPATQALPPAMPGYNPDNKDYGYDIESARKLIEEAGHGDGFTTELYTMNVDPNPRIAQAIQQDLAAIGIKAEIKSLAQAEVISAGGSGTAPMIWSGGIAYIADFPDAANLYWSGLSCGAAIEGGWNWARYCNKALDERAAKADGMVKNDQAAARIAEWRSVFDEISRDAPWVPIFNERQFAFHSARLGGDPALFVDPIHIPVNYDYIYSKDVQ